MLEIVAPPQPHDQVQYLNVLAPRREISPSRMVILSIMRKKLRNISKTKNLPEKLKIRYFSKFQIVLIDTFSVEVLPRINLQIFKIKNFTFCSFKS